MTLRIDWADLDLFGHVNNVAFFRYMQASRLVFCEKLGLSSLKEQGKLSFMVASSQCNFKKPLYYPGSVHVQTQVIEAGNSSFKLNHLMHDDSGVLSAEGFDVLVLYDYENSTKVSISELLRRQMLG